MEVLEKYSNTHALKTASVNPEQESQELPAWIGIVVLFAFCALSFYLLWAKTNPGL